MSPRLTSRHAYADGRGRSCCITFVYMTASKRLEHNSPTVDNGPGLGSSHVSGGRAVPWLQVSCHCTLGYHSCEWSASRSTNLPHNGVYEQFVKGVFLED